MNGINRALRVSFISLIISDIVLGKYTDYWAVHIEGGEEVARNVAAKHGFVYHGQILPDYYQFQHRKVAKRSVYPSSYYHRHLAHDPQVKWIEQQMAKKRVKRDITFNDPKWPMQWYLDRLPDGGKRDGGRGGIRPRSYPRHWGATLAPSGHSSRGGGLDMNVIPAWEQGYTGKGVVVTILDDGIEKDHPDLKNNYDELASYDVNGHDPDPQPRYDYTNENRHGTRCAGEVAAEANNHICSVGVAYNAKIGGVRMLDGDVTDSVEAQSLGLNPQHIHIYSASWGPDDDGRTVDGPATLARKAFYDGITKGRGGLGSIFVWASGNGGRDGDNCNCDGYTNSIYTLSISSSTENGNVPWYSESCSSTLATTYSSGSGGEKQIVTTDLRKDCTETHTGTSASAPLAAALIALTLQANPSMTWRDMQHVVVETARPDNLNAQDWVINGVGKKVSHSFGFGLMDAAAMVAMARNWTTVPDQHICEIRSLDHNRIVPMNGKLIVPLYTDGCEGTVNHVKYLEHVQARITMTSSRRGEIQINLTSPSLTRSILLAKRTEDNSREGFNNWAFMTTHNWGEPAKGQWMLEIENGASTFQPVRLRDWVLVLYGTDSHPRKSPTSVRSPKQNTWGERDRDQLGRGRDGHRQQQQQHHHQQQHQQQNNWNYPPHSSGGGRGQGGGGGVGGGGGGDKSYWYYKLSTQRAPTTTPTTTPDYYYDNGGGRKLGSGWSGWGGDRGGGGGGSQRKKPWQPPVQWGRANARLKHQHQHAHPPAAHTCVYETLAKKSNLSFAHHPPPAPLRAAASPPSSSSSRSSSSYSSSHSSASSGAHFPRNARPKLTAAELKEWTLVVMGTEKHPLKQNVSTQSSAANHAFTCAGVTSNGICIECKPGFFKMDKHCVAHCPDHFFGSVQAVHLASPIQPNSTKPLLHTQGVCKPCHPSCLTCRGAAPTDCFQCASGYEREGESAECRKTLLWDLLDPAVMKHFAWAIILCIGAIILCSLAFAILQARQRRRLCWASKHNYLPDWSKGAYNGLSTLEDPANSQGGGTAAGVARGVDGSGPDRGVVESWEDEGDGGGVASGGMGGVGGGASLFKPPSHFTPPPPLILGDYRLPGFGAKGGASSSYPTPTADPKV